MTYKMATGEDFKIITKSGGEIVFPAVENSPAFSGTASYVVGDKVYEGSTRYECIEDVAAPASGTNPEPSKDSTHWALSTVEMVTASEVVAPADATKSGQIADALAVKNALAGKLGNSGDQTIYGLEGTGVRLVFGFDSSWPWIRFQYDNGS